MTLSGPADSMADVSHIVAEALAAGITVATAESLTAGMLSAELASVPGASGMFDGAVVAYRNSVKVKVLGVSGALLEANGSVDADVARQMAQGVRRLTGSSLAVSTTGVAGPEAHDGKAVGTVFIALADEYGTWSQRYDFTGSRAEIRSAACRHGLLQLHQAIDAARPAR